MTIYLNNHNDIIEYIPELNNLNTLFYGVYISKKNNNNYILTKNSIKNDRVYNEKIFNFKNEQYRTWDPRRSKLGAIYKKKINVPSFKDLDILYLGASFGTTVSHISDILYDDNGRGIIYAIEFSDIPMRSLLLLSKKRGNILPIFEDAFFPERYEAIVTPVDLIFQDISQMNQINIAIKNSTMFLKKNCHLILIVKANSINSVLSTKIIYKEAISKINKTTNLKILKTIDLNPYYKDHLCILAKLKTD